MGDRNQDKKDKSGLILSQLVAIDTKLVAIDTKLQVVEKRVKYLENTSRKLDTYTWVLDKIGSMMNPFSLLGNGDNQHQPHNLLEEPDVGVD